MGNFFDREQRLTGKGEALQAVEGLGRFQRLAESRPKTDRRRQSACFAGCRKTLVGFGNQADESPRKFTGDGSSWKEDKELKT